MTNEEMSKQLRVLSFMLNCMDGDHTDMVDFCKLVATRLATFGGDPIAFMRSNDETDEMHFSAVPLTTIEKFEGWDEVPLFSHPVRPNADAQFSPDQRKGVVS